MHGLQKHFSRHVAFAYSHSVRPRLLSTSKILHSIRSSTPQSGRKERQKKIDEEIKNAPIGIWISLGISGILGWYTIQLVYAVVSAKGDAGATELSQQKDVVARYDEIADSFDGEVNISEWMMGLTDMRKRLSSMAKGDVLEVSCGTGRNLGYYELDNPLRRLTSLTLIDLSPQMIKVCKRKYITMRATSTREDKVMDAVEVRFATGSALNAMPLTRTGKKYDTIIQTMGLCSTPDPVELIVNMARHLDIDNPEARIYLLEHGRSYYDWFNRYLDGTARQHAEAFGCWYNRELDAILAEATSKCGFEIIRAKRKHVGTTYLYELKAGPTAVKKLEESLPAIEQSPTALSIWQKWFSGKAPVVDAHER